MDYVQATTAFHTKDGDGELIVHEGDIFEVTDPVVRRTPKEWWVPLQVRRESVPEEATANRKRTTKAADTDAAKH